MDHAGPNFQGHPITMSPQRYPAPPRSSSDRSDRPAATQTSGFPCGVESMLQRSVLGELNAVKSGMALSAVRCRFRFPCGSAACYLLSVRAG
jgi:hypothetical protein